MRERFFIPKQIAMLLWPQLLYVVVVPAFFVGFCIFYNPFDVNGYFRFDNYDPHFHIVMLGCIILVTVLLSRLLFLAIRKYLNVTLSKYLFWCLAETFAACCFMGLYIDLVFGPGMNYLHALEYSIKITYSIFVYPYAALLFFHYLRTQDEYRSDMHEEGTLVKFHDERGKLRLTIDRNSILFVTAEFNYIKIHYLDSGRVKVFMLRNSMKKIAESADHYGIIRCQRSYFVNPRHVRVLRKDAEGFITAELDFDSIQPVPVSKQYYEALASLL